MSNKKVRAIVIDDDPINNHICQRHLQLAFGIKDIELFTDPEKGLEYIRKCDLPEDTVSIVLLDINMPMMTGWEVLDKIEDFPSAIKDHYRIYILSSSIASEDREKAGEHILVQGFIEKPLSFEQLSKLFPEYIKAGFTWP